MPVGTGTVAYHPYRCLSAYIQALSMSTCAAPPEGRSLAFNGSLRALIVLLHYAFLDNSQSILLDTVRIRPDDRFDCRFEPTSGGGRKTTYMRRMCCHRIEVMSVTDSVDSKHA